MHDVFISYSGADAGIARSIADRLKRDGFSIFIDRGALVGREEYSLRIAAALENAPAVIVLLSANSSRSSWVQEELASALEKDKLVVPVLLDKEGKNNWVWPLIANRQPITLDAGSGNADAALEHLVLAVERAIGKTNQPPLPVPQSRNRPYLWIAIASIISAVIGGLVVWWLRY